MDDCRRCCDIPPLLSSRHAFFCEEEEEEEETEAERLRQALLYATAQLESARAATRDELTTLERRALHLARLLEAAARERDEARRRCRSLLLSPPVGAPLPLPEKGALVEAVMRAGPLLQTLLLTGPLPRWQVPPPPLGCHEIPPVVSVSVSASLSNEDRREERDYYDRKRKKGAAAATSSSSPDFLCNVNWL